MAPAHDEASRGFVLAPGSTAGFHDCVPRSLPLHAVHSDCKDCGSNRRPSGVAKRKLTDADVAELLRLRGEGWTVARLSSRFGISWHAVDYRIHNGTTRARVPAPPRPPRAPRPAPSLYKNDSLGHYLLRERYSPMVEAALCALTPGLRRYLDEDDELRAKRGVGR